MTSRRSRTGKAVLVIVVVLAVVAVAAGAAAMLGPRLLHRGAPAAKAAGKPTAAVSQPATRLPAADEGEAPVVELGEFLVNLEGTSESRYLRAEVSIRVTGLPASERKRAKGAATKDELPAGDLAVAKDCVTTVLSSGVFAQLRSVGGREKLKHETLVRLQEALPKYRIQDVLFTSFVMQ